MIRNDEFVEYNIYNNNYYGTSKSELSKSREDDRVINIINNEKIILLEIDITGAKKVKECFEDSYLFTIIPPNVDVLKSRIEKRGGMTDKDLQDRLNIAKNELELIEQLNNKIKCSIVNDDLSSAYDNLKTEFLKL